MPLHRCRFPSPPPEDLLPREGRLEELLAPRRQTLRPPCHEIAAVRERTGEHLHRAAPLPVRKTGKSEVAAENQAEPAWTSLRSTLKPFEVRKKNPGGNPPGFSFVPRLSAQDRQALSDLCDVGRLWSLGPLRDLELDLVAFCKAFEALRPDRAEVDEHIRPPICLADESEPLRVVEPLHASSLQNNLQEFVLAQSRRESPNRPEL